MERREEAAVELAGRRQAGIPGRKGLPPALSSAGSASPAWFDLDERDSRRPGVALYRYIAREALFPTLIALVGLTAVVLTKELLGLVASTVLRCDDCISYHLIECKESGFSDEQVMEAMTVALVVGGSITIPHIRRAADFLDELSEESEA